MGCHCNAGDFRDTSFIHCGACALGAALLSVLVSGCAEMVEKAATKQVVVLQQASDEACWIEEVLIAMPKCLAAKECRNWQVASPEGKGATAAVKKRLGRGKKKWTCFEEFRVQECECIVNMTVSGNKSSMNVTVYTPRARSAPPREEPKHFALGTTRGPTSYRDVNGAEHADWCCATERDANISGEEACGLELNRTTAQRTTDAGGAPDIKRYRTNIRDTDSRGKAFGGKKFTVVPADEEFDCVVGDGGMSNDPRKVWNGSVQRHRSYYETTAASAKGVRTESRLTGLILFAAAVLFVVVGQFGFWARRRGRFSRRSGWTSYGEMDDDKQPLPNSMGASDPNTGRVLQVKVPPGTLPGMQLEVHTQNGKVAVCVPPGVAPGQLIDVRC